MKWISYETIKAAAKRGRIAAIRCSLDHWQQIESATQEEIQKLEETDDYMTRQKGCALCHRYYVGASQCDRHGRSLGCTQCPLREKGTRSGCTSGSLWSNANGALCSWLNHRNDTDSEKYWQNWKYNAHLLVKRLSQILEQERAKKKTVQHRTK